MRSLMEKWKSQRCSTGYSQPIKLASLSHRKSLAQISVCNNEKIKKNTSNNMKVSTMFNTNSVERKSNFKSQRKNFWRTDNSEKMLLASKLTTHPGSYSTRRNIDIRPKTGSNSIKCYSNKGSNTHLKNSPFKHSDKKIIMHRAKTLKEILNDYLKGQEESMKNMRKLQKIRKTLQLSNRILNNLINKRNNVEKRHMNNYTRYVKNNKPLFVYGKYGNGRYLDNKGIDYLGMRDVVLKANRRYNFLEERLDDYYKKRKGLI